MYKVEDRVVIIYKDRVVEVAVRAVYVCQATGQRIYILKEDNSWNDIIRRDDHVYEKSS